MSTPRAINNSQLQLIAIQLDSIRSLSHQATFLQRGIWRFRNEFLHGSHEVRLRLLKYAVRQTLLRIRGVVAARTKRPAKPTAFSTNGIHIAAVCDGGMGDITIASAMLDHLFRESGSPTIHAIVNPLRSKEAEFVFHNSPSVKAVLTDADLDPESTPYDLILRIGDFVSYRSMRKDRLERLAPALLEKVTAAWQLQQQYRGFIDVAPAFDGLFASIATRSGLRRLDVLGWLANVSFTQNDQLHLSPSADAYRRFVDDLQLADKRYITIHNGFDNVALQASDTVTKAWPEENYVEFVERFKAHFPDVLVIQLGAKTSRPIKNVDLCLLNDTSLDEAVWVLKHSLLHVDGDSGLVHLARSLHTKSLTLFGPTNHEYFRYAQNEVITSETCSNCWYTSFNWVRSCPRGLREPECMKSIDAVRVFQVAQRYLSSLPSWNLKIEDSCCYQETASNSDEAAGSKQCDGAFPEWQRRYVADKLESIYQSKNSDLSLAILAEPKAPGRFASLPYRHTTFAFEPGDKCRRNDSQGETAAIDASGEGQKTTWDFGSIYNIPAENETYDVVVVPSLTADIAFPRMAIKESLRILREEGILMITFDFSSSPSHDDKRQGVSNHGNFFQSFDDLGVRGRLPHSQRGGIVLQKLRNGRTVVKGVSRADKSVGFRNGQRTAGSQHGRHAPCGISRL